jgi:hypothetical protein
MVRDSSTDERFLIEALCREIDALTQASDASPGIRTVAAIISAARHARRTNMPAGVAAALIAQYILRGDPF